MEQIESSNSLDDFENVKIELEKLIQKLGHFPSSSEFRKNNASKLASHIRRKHGGLLKVRKILGFKLAIKEDKYWMNFENVKREIEEAIQELGHFPSFDELKKIGRSSLNTAISHFGGFRKVREILGYNSSIRPSGAWKNLEFTLEQARNFLKEHPEYATLPNGYTLSQLGYSALNTSITKYHGGYYKFRKLLGEKPPRATMGGWRKIEFTIEQACNFLEEHPEYKTLPGSTTLDKTGYSGLAAAIRRYHGGFESFRKILEVHIEIKKGSWKSLEFTLHKAKEFLKEHPEYETLPSGNVLLELEYSSLGTAIAKYHGGFPVFREILKRRMTERSTKEELEELLESYAGDD